MRPLQPYGCALATITAITASATAQTVPNVRVNAGSFSGTFVSSPSLAAAGSSVYVVWEDPRNGPAEPYFNRSLDGGATWLTADVRLNTGIALGTTFSPRVSASGPFVYVIWLDQRSGNLDLFFNRSLDAGTTWAESDKRVNTVSAPGVFYAGVVFHTMAVSGSSVFVAWVDERYGDTDVFFNRSLDSGRTWLPDDVRLDVGSAPGAASSIESVIASDSSSVYLVWRDDRDGEYDVYFNRSVDSGATWLPDDVRLDVGSPVGSADSFEPWIDADGSSSAYVVWTDGRNGGNSARDIYFNRSLDSGTTWLPDDMRLDLGSPPGTADSFCPKIVAQGMTIYVAWEDTRNGRIDIYFNRSLDAGTTWLANDVRLDVGDAPGANFSTFLQLCAAGPAVFAAWDDNRDFGIYFNRSLDAGTTWLPAAVRISNGVSARTPQLASGSSSAYLVFEDSLIVNGQEDIYFALPLGHQPYGQGTPGAGGLVPALSASGEPAIGATFSLELTNGVGGAGALILYGLGGKASVPALGGMLLVQPPVFRLSAMLGGASGVPGAGSLALPIAIPNDLSLLGLRVNSQGGVFDPSAQGGIALTGGLETWVL